MKCCVFLSALLPLAFLASAGTAQEVPIKTEIRRLLDGGQMLQADQLLKRKLDFFSQHQLPDSLAAYISLAGDIAQEKRGVTFAKQTVAALVRKIGLMGATSGSLREAYANLGEFYGAMGDNPEAYKAHLEALSFAQQAEDTSAERIALMHRNLGEYARRMANLDLARKHYMIATALVSQQADPDQKQLYQTYMSLGVLSWYSAKLDSAEYFFNKSIDAVKQIDDSQVNTHFRQAMLLNNLAGVYSLQGRTNQAIRSMENSIGLLREFLSRPDYADEKKQALSLQFEAIDNLGGAYKELGNYAKTEQLLLYSFEQKKLRLQADDPAIFISEILLGQLYYATSDYKKAIEYLTEGRKAIAEAGADYLFWDADACYTLAMIHEKQHADRLAESYYRKADSLYALAFGDTYDNIYLEFLRRYAAFQAKLGRCETATALAEKTLHYVTDAGNERSLLLFYQLQHFSELAFQCRDFRKAYTYAQRALDEISKFIDQSATLEDSIKTEGEKVHALLIRAKASYELSPDKRVDELHSLLGELEEATQIVDRKKRILTDQKDVTGLIASYQSLIDFIKQLHFELYSKTGDDIHLKSGLNVHEGAIYSRLRSRMDYQRALKFAHVPGPVLDEENRLKKNIRTSLQQLPGTDGAVRAYRYAVDHWDTFLNQLEQRYPAYYRMRYAQDHFTLGGIGELLPADVTVVRYVSLDKQLFAFVSSAEKWAFIPLRYDGLAQHVEVLRDFGQQEQQLFEAANQLYVALWQPLETLVVGSRVIVIPDGILHHVSFDMLAPVPVASLGELAANCLLNRYAISYHYSLLALGKSDPAKPMTNNFVAFAPVFSDRNKATYLSYAQEDSLTMDRAYATLLPLPFSAKLAQKMQREWGGSLFTEERSTAHAFRSNAANHRIIHIGTHAEANNDYPEYSRLIFTNDGREGVANSVYLYDIYNCDLTAEVAVLTACETGKSGYLDGEGMISMAHAFNYAGSESILAGLWKIDEQSSMDITESFYRQLQLGAPKDIALQRAKLAYLQKAEGRLLSPQYWAGLAIMGDLGPVELHPTTPYRYIMLGLLLAAFVAGIIVMSRKRDMVQR